MFVLSKREWERTMLAVCCVNLKLEEQAAVKAIA